MRPVPFISPLQTVSAVMDVPVWLTIWLVQPVSLLAHRRRFVGINFRLGHADLDAKVWADGIFTPMVFILAIASGGICTPPMSMVVEIFHRPALP